MDEVQKKNRRIMFDVLDIQPENSFLVAGEVWLGCRKGSLDPMHFGDSETDLGMPPIRYALLHDFAALNKFELLGNDDWGELVKKKESDLTEDDLKLLDNIADVTKDPDRNFGEMRDLFDSSSYGKDIVNHPI